MDTERLLNEIKETGLRTGPVNIGEGLNYYDGFNLIKRPDGKWETSFVEKGYPYDIRIYETEEEAAKGFLDFIKENCSVSPVVPSFFSAFFGKHRNLKEKNNSKERK